MTGLKVLALLCVLMLADGAARTAVAEPGCGDPRLPRVDSVRREVPTRFGRGIIETTTICRAESATYSGPYGDGMATLITQTYRYFEIDVGNTWIRLFLAAPDGSWREIKGIKNDRVVTTKPNMERRVQRDPRDVVAGEVSNKLNGVPWDALFQRIALAHIEEPGDELCFTYSSDYPFVVHARVCSLGQTSTEARFADKIVPVPDARRIAAETWVARYGGSKESEIRHLMRLSRIIDRKEIGQFRYEFDSNVGGFVNDVAVAVDGLSGQAEFVLVPCSDTWRAALSGPEPDRCPQP